MFVPRALRLKGVKEQERPQKERPAKKRRIATDASEVTETDDSNTKASDASVKRPEETRSTAPAVKPDYLAQLVSGVELLFTDYAHQDPDGAEWLLRHYRDVEGQPKFIHLSAVLRHTNISSLKPVATQLLLQQALREQGSKYLELSENGYYVRRQPSTYPMAFVPENSFKIVDDDGVSFWDQRTIYVEPHIRYLCQTPAKVAHWLKEYGGMREKWLPIQAVHTLYNSCAFVVLSGNVTHEGTWEKWRKTEKPEWWKVLTKLEHTKRTNEYLELLAKERGETKGDTKGMWKGTKKLAGKEAVRHQKGVQGTSGHN